MVRTAFLIGNKSYAQKGQCVNWWEDIANAFHDVDVAHDILEECGFECEVPFKDATAADLRSLPRLTAQSLQNTHSSLSLWLYSGHGVTVAGRLYLIPADFAKELPYMPVSTLLSSVLSLLASLSLSPSHVELCPGHLSWIVLVVLCLLGWIAVGRWSLRALWQVLTWHPLAEAVCFDDLEADLANIHETHRASRAVFVFLLDCCREHRQFGRWHQLLMWWQGLGCSVDQHKASSRSSRPNFFTVFACESGRCAFYYDKESSHGFLVAAFLETLRKRGSGRCSLDCVFQGICSHMHDVRTSCGFGRQKPCIYSTAYAMSKDILFVDPSTSNSSPVPTLLVSMSKARMIQWAASDVDVLRKHRASFSLRRRQQLVCSAALSEEARAIMILRDVAVEKTSRQRRFLRTVDYVTAIRSHGVRPRNVHCVMCMINIMQAKYLCDKATVLVTDAVFANQSRRNSNLASAERKIGRIECLVEKVVCEVEACSVEPFFRGRVEEIIAGSLAVQLLKKLATLKAQPHFLRWAGFLRGAGALKQAVCKALRGVIPAGAPLAAFIVAGGLVGRSRCCAGRARCLGGRAVHHQRWWVRGPAEARRLHLGGRGGGIWGALVVIAQWSCHVDAASRCASPRPGRGAAALRPSGGGFSTRAAARFIETHESARLIFAMRCMLMRRDHFLRMRQG